MMMKSKVVIDRIEELSKGDPKRKELLNDLYDELNQFFKDKPGIVYTQREQSAFIEGIRFYIDFDNNRSKREITNMEKEIANLEIEIAGYKGEKP